MLDRAEKDLKRGRPLLAVARSVADAPCWEKARAAGSLLCLRELSQACTRLSNFAKKGGHVRGAADAVRGPVPERVAPRGARFRSRGTRQRKKSQGSPGGTARRHSIGSWGWD